MYETFGEKEEKELHEMRRRFGKLRFETDHNIEKSKLMNSYIDQTKQDANCLLLNQYPQSKMSLNLQRNRLQTNISIIDSNSNKRNILSKIPIISYRHFSARTLTNRITSLPNNFNFPKQMEERQDFQNWKSNKQKNIVTFYLQTLSLFQLMPLEMLKELGGRLTYIELKTENDLTLCRYGEKGECMFILFKGKVDVISSDGKLLKVFGSNEHIGRGALETDAPRILLQESILNLINQNSKNGTYNNVLIIYSKLKDQSGRSLLKQYIFLIVFNKYLYKVGDQVDNFYIVKNGTLVMNVVVDLEKSNRWPF